jgi:hypothetical protein
VSFSCIVSDCPLITPEWFAGFVDGEGTFNIGGDRLQPRFALNQRDDDSELVRAIHKFLGVGSLHTKSVNPDTKYGYIKGNPQLKLNVAGCDCLVIVGYLDQAPLRSKKAREYPFWKKAVMDYSTHIGDRYHPEIVIERQSRLSVLKEQLESVRIYRGAV